MKILIIKPSALGDIVQALPVLTGLKRRWPAAQIDWIVNDSLREILEGHPCLRQTILYPRKRWTTPNRLPEMWRWGKQLRAEKYDMTIDLQGLLRSALMTWAANSPRRLGLQSAREGSRAFYNEFIADTALSAAERYLTCLEHLDIPVQPLDFQLIRPRAAAGGAQGLRPLHRPAPLFALAHQTLALALLSGAGRLHARPQVRRRRGRALVPARGARTSRRPARPALHRHTRHCPRPAQAVLSTDSGPAHIAGALGRPTLVLFGATDWRKTKPSGAHVFVRTHALFCSPCLKRTCWRDTPVECMSLLAPQKIRTALLAIAS